MKEIKLRAWNKNKKRMETPETLIYLDKLYVGYFDNSGYPKINKDYILLQYTGIKDRKGKKIYEGDIINCSSGHEIEWAKKNGFISPIKFDTGTIDLGINNYEYSNYVCGFIANTEYLTDCFVEGDCEVIGNIYKNPELIKE